MSTVGRLDVELGLDANKINKGLKDESKRLNKWSDSLKKTGAKFTAGVTLPVVAGFGMMISSASDLAEAQSAVGTVFGDVSSQILKAAKGSATSMGISEEAYLSASTKLGVFGKMAGATGDDLASFSKDSMTAAADLASFYNAPVEDVLAAWQSGLMGEAEPMRQFGVMMNDASIQQYALTNGIWDGTGAMTESQKVMARQGFMLDNMGDASGDFARTSKGLANQMRIMKARLKDVSAQFGVFLLPYMLKGVTFGQKMIDWVTSLTDKQKKWALAFAAVGAALGPVLIILGSMLPAIIALTGPIGLIVLGLGALGTAYATNLFGFRDAINAVFSPIRKFVGYVVKLVGAFKDAFSSGKEVQDLASGMGTYFSAAGTQFLSVETIVKRFPGPLQKFAKGLLLVADGIGDLVARWKSGGFEAMLDLLPEKLRQIGRGLGLMVGELIGALKDLATKIFDSLQKTIDAVNWNKLGTNFGEKARAMVISLAKGFWKYKEEIATGLIKAIVAIPALLKYIAPKALEFVKGFVKGLNINWPLIWAWMKTLPGKLVTALGNLLPLLVPAGKELIAGFRNGIEARWPQAKEWLSKIPTYVINAIGNVANVLVDVGKTLMRGLWTGALDRFASIVIWLKEIPGKVLASVGDLTETLKSKGIGLLNGFFNGIFGVWSGSEGELGGGIKGWISGLPGKIVGSIGDLTKALYYKGRDLIEGLWNGMKDRFDILPGWAQSIVEAGIGLLSVGSPPTTGGPPSGVTQSYASRAMAGGGRPVTIYNTYQIDGYNKDVYQLANEIARIQAHDIGLTIGSPA